METIVITQSPAQPPQAGVNKLTENNGDDTSFAPTLAEAISRKSKSDTSKKETDNTSSPSQTKKKEIPSEQAETNVQSSQQQLATDTASSTNQLLNLIKGLASNKAESESSASYINKENISSSDIASQTNNKNPIFLKQNDQILKSASLKLGNTVLPSATLPDKSLTKSFSSQKPVQIAEQKLVSTVLNKSAHQKNGIVKDAVSPTPSFSRLTSAQTKAFNSQPETIPTNVFKVQQESIPNSSLNSKPVSTDNITNLFSPNSKDSIKWTATNNNASQVMPRNSFSFLNLANETTYETPKHTVSTENIIANLTDLLVEPEVTTGKTINSTSLRHDINGQYLDAKMQKNKVNLTQQNGQQQLGAEDDPAKQSQLLSQSAKTIENQSESTFANTASNVIADKANQQIAAPAKPITTPLSTPVNEDDIILQVIQKFRSTAQLQDNKLVMKLHPAELGELKINIQLKSGSINANIVAQSLHVQEILEKNMPKLRNLMEQQGIVIGDMSVKLDSDVVADYNLFQQHFSKDEKTLSSRKTAKSPESFDLSLEDAEDIQETLQSGVNVKA